jgi:hypothetical protein
MNFADLYRFSNSLGGQYTRVEDLQKHVVRTHPAVHEVEFWACTLDSTISRGHMILCLDRSSPYDDEYIVASIRYDRELENDWRRFVCCKELMHVFDISRERVDDREKFLKLMEELENAPLPAERSPMYDSERNAEWMAVLAICPQRLRDHYLGELNSGRMNPEAIAAALRIPEILIKSIMSDRYMRQLESLTGEGAVAARR